MQQRGGLGGGAGRRGRSPLPRGPRRPLGLVLVLLLSLLLGSGGAAPLPPAGAGEAREAAEGSGAGAGGVRRLRGGACEGPRRGPWRGRRRCQPRAPEERSRCSAGGCGFPNPRPSVRPALPRVAGRALRRARRSPLAEASGRTRRVEGAPSCGSRLGLVALSGIWLEIPSH